MTTARACSVGTRRRDTITGAPHTLFVVKTPDAAAGRSDTNSAKSDLPLALMPQVKPDAEKPVGSEAGIDIQEEDVSVEKSASRTNHRERYSISRTL